MYSSYSKFSTSTTHVFFRFFFLLSSFGELSTDFCGSGSYSKFSSLVGIALSARQAPHDILRWLGQWL